MRGSPLTTRKAGARLLGRIHGGSWADRRYGGEVEKKELAGAGRRRMGAGDGGIRPGGAKFLQVETGLVLRANAHVGRLRRLIAAVAVMNSDHGDSHALQRLELAEGHSASSTSCLPHALLHPRPLLGLMLLPAQARQACRMLLLPYILKMVFRPVKQMVNYWTGRAWHFPCAIHTDKPAEATSSQVSLEFLTMSTHVVFRLE
ncbi:uncharacterized protein LOC119326079 isoform X2 [Triticum dicoccoides]|uniref:uncharacterized protein LOC119326079 isoform X2 n=1 Tax=Triticum dicoccoides TaxID=85692 RepID=UPI001890BFC7|nr:uncharacterized protein LOC119326079 isoform X2 [Triticum dicoccoides]